MQLINISAITGWKDYLLVLAGYVVLLSTSGRVINFMLRQIANKTLEETAGKDQPDAADRKRRLAAGIIIGKCENIIILSFILLEAYTALALVVTAKTLVRKEEIEKNEMYFLVGTLVNVSYSVLISFIVLLLITVVK
jgi:hypothetical protein